MTKSARDLATVLCFHLRSEAKRLILLTNLEIQTFSPTATIHGEESQILLDHANRNIKWQRPHIPGKQDGYFWVRPLLRVTGVAAANLTFLSQVSYMAGKLIF